MSGESVFLSLGSNLGQREENLLMAVKALRDCLRELRCSSVYETRPLYVRKQPNFLNMVVAGLCLLQPAELLRQILSIELRMGRDRNHYIPKGPRIIDIDILLFGEQIIKQEKLTVPHPHLKERQFVLVPLLELEPELKDPESGRPFSESLQKLGDQGVYIFRA
ncbi:MAG: 2-amino-4-hydroxy-6-hydroxymethyldihydropteridine diphosphokinase [Spirochaetaceae bacterium]|nr:MAG: 2-amino-4-hydroxy-6-hydroxymethyldihydropteridine diphosphokinase [Spirochaetaceae bacterium]